MNIIFSTLNTLLENIFSVTGDWGVTIIILTLFIRIALLPVSLKQRGYMEKQQLFARRVEEIKDKFQNDKEKMEAEIAKISKEGAKNMLGCSITLLQFPVMYSLYRVFMNMPAQIGTLLIPWVSSLKLPDAYFIIPVISVLIQITPGLLVWMRVLNGTSIPKLTKSQLVVTSAINIMFMAKAPISLGIYWLTTNMFTVLEQVAYSLYKRNKCVTIQ